MGQLLPLVKVVKLGRISYSKASKIQSILQQKYSRSQEEIVNHAVLLLEHDPVYTFGLREKISDEDSKNLKEAGAEVVKSNRGGLTTFHGPGQLVVYPILDLRNFKMSLRNYVTALEMTAIHTCRMFGVFAVPGRESAAHTGAWAGEKKICAIGVHCKRHVTTHGLALNCNTNLAWFEKIVPCGISNKGVTSLSEQLDSDISVNCVMPQFISSFQTIFRCRTMHVTLDRLLEADFKHLGTG